ncbi:MAG: response regulator, partial [Pseudomonadota bacterium]
MSKRALPNRLVIAEDSDDDYEFTSRALQKMGGDTLTLHRCHDGQELLDYLATEVDLGQKPDLIL